MTSIFVSVIAVATAAVGYTHPQMAPWVVGGIFALLALGGVLEAVRAVKGDRS